MKLYKSTEKSFLDNGFGNIQAISCLETKKKSLNGWYIECKFPIKYIDVLKQDRILYVETKEKGGQVFRINNIKCTDRYIELTANHVVFDAERYLLDDVRPTDLNPTSFLKWCNERTDTVSPFSVSSNVNGVGTRYFVRKSLLECFSDAESLFGGVFDANNFDVRLLQKVGNNNGYSIIYGKNLQSVSIVEDWSSVVTKLLPVGPNGITLTEKYLQSDIQYEKPYTKTVTFDVPTNYKQGDSTIDYTPEEIKSFLKQKALEYLEQNKIPKINYTVASDVPQELCIGDTITIKHPLVEIKTEVQSYQYDVIAKRVKKLEFGNYDKSVKKIFDSIKETIKKNEAALQEQNNVIQQQSDLINKLNKDGYVYIDENEILILDTLPKEKAKNVWRFGLGGIGFSSNGINGPFESALTQDGTFNTNFIKANSITVNHLSPQVGSNLNLTSNNSIVIAINESLKNDGTIGAASFTLDKNGGHFKNGGIDIQNNLGEKVMEADVNGNLITKNLKSINGNFEGTIESSKIFTSNFEAEKMRVAVVKEGDDVLIRDFVIGTGFLSQEDQSRLDFNNDGKITTVDYMLAREMLAGTLSKEWHDYVYVKMDDQSKYSFVMGTENLKDTSVKFETVITNGSIDVRNIEGIEIKMSKVVSDSVDASSLKIKNKNCTSKIGYQTDASSSLSVTNEDGNYLDFNFQNKMNFIMMGGNVATSSFYVGEGLDGNSWLGQPTRRWGQIYSTKPTISTSDRNQKKDIADISVKYEEMFKRLRPVSFKFKNKGSDRVHLGFVAQEVKETMDIVGLTDEEFGGYCRDLKKEEDKYHNWHDAVDEQGNKQYIYSLRYEEFIALNTKMIQLCLEELEKQNQEIEDLKTKLNEKGVVV